MAKILVVPVNRHINIAAVAQTLAATLPDAAVFNPVADLVRAQDYLAAGEGDDWLDLLIGEASAYAQKNLVIQGIVPDADQLLLSAQNVELATAFNAQVVFVDGVSPL